MTDITLSTSGLTQPDVVAVARRRASVSLGDDARAAMERSRAIVEQLAASGTPAYGVSTGFGALATTYIPEARRRELQVSLVRSHAAGMGPRVEEEVVRAMMLLRARSLAMGHSGARPIVAEALLAMLEAGITPVVYEYGSLGASGDLAPLAHVALGLIGEGTVTVDGTDRPAADALADAGLTTLALIEKEGLALINGTDGILGMLILALADLTTVARAADVVAAMTVEAVLGTDRAFRPDLIAMRPHPGQGLSAANMFAVMAGSEVVASHREDDPRVQDAYSLRCSPQVHGAVRDTIAHAADVADHELAAAIDNPVVTSGGSVESCGNFHGAPVAFACDFLAIAAAELGSISERRTDRLLDPARSHGLPPFLTRDPGVSSGLMIAHYTAVSMAAENRRLAAPASVDSMPTSAMQEDHVSMGWGAARKLRIAAANVARIVAVELVAACQALELRSPLEPSPASAAVLEVTRESIEGLEQDRHLAPDLAAATELITSGRLLGAAESVTGDLA
ncbi:MAG: histidine ammonia-lyase [Acidimicrobiia bacterium]|nr:histidine ammonia-lyase [Acidimicrobiia bacterium]